MIRIYCEAADAVLKETQTLTAGMTNYPEVVLTFSEDWEGFGKAAVCRAGETYVDVLIENNKFIVPAECFTSAGVSLIIGIQGSNGTQVIPTIWCSCGEILEGTDVNEGNVGTVTPDLVDQMLGAVADAVAAAEGADSEAWARGSRGGVPVAPTDETYHNNSKYYSETAAANAGYLNFGIVPETGHLHYTRTDDVDVDFYIDTETGHLMLGEEPT